MAAGKSKRNSQQDSTQAWLDPGEDGANLETEDFISTRILRLAFLIQRNLLRPYVLEAGLSIPEWRLLALLVRESPVPFSGLGVRSMMDKSLVSRALRQMADKGLVKVDPDPDHRRKLVVTVAPAGRALYRRILPSARRSQLTLVSVLSTDERLALHEALAKLLDSVSRTRAADYRPLRARRNKDEAATAP